MPPDQKTPHELLDLMNEQIESLRGASPAALETIQLKLQGLSREMRELLDS